MRPRAVSSLLLLLPLLFLPPPAGTAAVRAPSSTAPASAVAYAWPVLAPVADPFRPPPHPYGPGNLGVELATTPGDDVRAAAPGVVTFAGPVAGAVRVTVQHPDRVRTTYGPLGAAAVAVGDAVDAGTLLGPAAGPVLWSARLGTAYVDPAVLVAASGPASARLVADGG